MQPRQARHLTSACFEKRNHPSVESEPRSHRVMELRVHFMCLRALPHHHVRLRGCPRTRAMPGKVQVELAPRRVRILGNCRVSSHLLSPRDREIMTSLSPRETTAEASMDCLEKNDCKWSQCLHSVRPNLLLPHRWRLDGMNRACIWRFPALFLLELSEPVVLELLEE